MGPSRYIPTPVAFRERDTKPLGGVEKGVEIIEKGITFWGATLAEAFKKAEEAGYII